MTLAVPALEPVAEAQAATSTTAAPHTLSKLTSGEYLQGAASGKQPSLRTMHPFLTGMLPDNIRLESHFTALAPGAPPEPVHHHAHTEMWFVHQGAVTLMTAGVTRTLKAGEMGLCIAGDDHSITNASASEPASYFVVSVGPPE